MQARLLLQDVLYVLKILTFNSEVLSQRALSTVAPTITSNLCLVLHYVQKKSIHLSNNCRAAASLSPDVKLATHLLSVLGQDKHQN